MMISTLASFLVLCIFASADDMSSRMDATLVQMGHPLKLECSESDDPVKWFKDDSELKPGDRIVISSSPNKLTVSKVTAKDGGSYNCKTNGDQVVKDFNVQVEPHVKFPAKSVNAIGGEKFELKCEAGGYPAPTLSWLKDNIALDLNNQTSRYNFSADENNLPNAILRIAVLEESDEGNYTCRATVDVTEVEANVLVRVKDKWAAVYPFIGIVIEVVVLVTIIFIYEKKRSKDRQEIDDGHAQEKSNVNNKDSDVRQRK